MSEWLVRTSQNQVFGPIPKEEVCRMIREGQLGLEDEVCLANGYWIFLYEREEVRMLLGIEGPVAPARSGNEEVTETQTETGSLVKDSASHDSRFPRIEASVLDQVGENTAVLNNRTLRDFSARIPVGQKSVPRMESLSPPVLPTSAQAMVMPLKDAEAPVMKRYGWLFLAAIGLVLIALLKAYNYQ